MSFTGDLEHLPIVDVIQLLNATRKSGTLTVKSSKGESGLVFKDGYIVSANHLNDSVRIGKILVEHKVVTDDALAQALQEQKSAGKGRKPLIATLLEQGRIKKGDGFSCLENLIEMTIVEVLTWGQGTFSFDMGSVAVSDEYRYFPENLHQEIYLDAQSALMDALRIYDEKKRDGKLGEGDFWAEGGRVAELAAEAAEAEEETTISAEDLGLDELDRLERKIPKVFVGIDVVDPREIHRRKIREAAPWASPEEQEKLVGFLIEMAAAAGEKAAPSTEGAQVVVLLSADPLLAHALTTACGPAGVSVFATDEEQDLAPILDHYLAKTTLPLVVLDRPEPSGAAAEEIAELRRQMRSSYPQVSTIQLAAPGDYRFSLQAFANGARAVFPRPLPEKQKDSFAGDLIAFLQTFPPYLRTFFQVRGQGGHDRFKGILAALREVKAPPTAALTLLHFVSERVERALTLVVKPTELIVERSIGVGAAKEKGASTPMGFRFPLADSATLRDVIAQGSPFFGECGDAALEVLFKKIGAPRHASVLLLPMRGRGKTLSLTYGDFGAKDVRPIPMDLLEMLAEHVGLILENGVLRKKLER